MAFAAGTKVKINNPDAGPYFGKEATVVSLDVLNGDVFDIDALKANEEVANGNVVELTPDEDDFAGFLASMQENNENGSFHVVVPDSDLLAV